MMRTPREKRRTAINCLLALAFFTISGKTAVRAERPARKPAVAVISFRVLPQVKHAPADCGYHAAQMVAFGLARSKHYRQYLWPKPIRIKAPLYGWGYPEFDITPPGWFRFCRTLGASEILAGVVSSAAFCDNRRFARVTVNVMLFDVAAGGMVNGAIATGYSLPRKGNTSDAALIDQALTDAARNAVKTINSYTLPVATILTLNGSRKEVRLNRGERDGMIVGQEMVVTRHGGHVGCVRVTQVRVSDSRACIVKTSKEIRSGDLALAVLSIPD